MKRSFWVYALVLGVCVVLPALSRGQNISPVGAWQVNVLGSEKGTLIMTFTTNSTVTGYGILRKNFGFITLSGTWGFDSKGDVVAGYTQTANGVSSAFRLKARMLSSIRFRGKATGTSGDYQCKGEQLESYPDLSGTWNGPLKRKGEALYETFVSTLSSNYPAVFDITGSGLGDTGSFTLAGEIIVSSDNKVNALINRTFGTDTQHSSLSGVFKSRHSGDQLRLQGNDDTGAHISETVTR
jgi:hypothetical protein